ncbi:MAG TPA: L,D-transpeptidase family protein [Flavisolibacter sp.]|jgi:murein L,D-transpeptidase YcbB/YkuD|nr:L,D-transpeptidase family protein [Flavisolibacter sp.]
MMKGRLSYMVCLVILSLFVMACANAGNQLENSSSHEAKTNTNGVSVEDAYSDLVLDSLAIEKFISSHNIEKSKADYLRDFYQSRDYQYAWFTQDGLDEHGRAFWNLHNNFLNYAQDSSLFDKQLHRQMELLVNDETEASFKTNELRDMELSLTEHFFDYARYAFTGSVDPKKLKWYIPRKRLNAVALLDSLIATNGENLDEWEPVNQQYKQMRTALMRYYKIEKQGGWQEIKGDQKVYKQGDSAAAVQRIKSRLLLTGDFTSQDQSALFTSELEAAVQAAQKRFGLVQDGVVGPATLRALNKPVSERIEQMLVNMERMRWMPAHGEGRRLVANIPEYKLHVYEGAKEVFDMRIVVGKAAHKTVVFNDQLKHVVFSPYWNVPASIVRNEILPAMKRNPSYLQANNMEQTGTRNGLPVIRQKPGANNALGRVKFLFPNSYAIYFHDTPAKHLFDENKRAFSHGCIRLAEPKRLAEYLLQDKEGWNDSRITSAMYAGTEKWVNLSEPVPVAITYFTSWVDDQGQVNFRNDIYGHDKALAERLFK